MTPVHDDEMTGALPPLDDRSTDSDGLPPLGPSAAGGRRDAPPLAPVTVESDAPTVGETAPITVSSRAAVRPPRDRSGRGRTAALVALAVTAGALGGGIAAWFVGGNDQPTVPTGGSVVPTADAGRTSVLPLQDAIASVRPSVVQVRTREGQGSGVVLQPRGFIITNNHVAGAKGNRVTIVTGDNREVPADVVFSDPQRDLDVLNPQGSVGPGAALASEPDCALRAGDTVFAIGSPFGLMNTVTVGVVSATNRPGMSGQRMIQTDAAINPGNSGGGLFDLRGRLVGVPTSINSPVPGNVGIGFAVTCEQVRKALASVK